MSSRLSTEDRVYPSGFEDDPEFVTACAWWAKCPNPANGLRDHPILGDVPICQRCDDKVERLSQPKGQE